MNTFDLAVVGGGPAGAAAAITAARAGTSVILLERGRYPRHKVCGEFVSPEGVSLLDQLGLKEVTAAPRIAHARIFADSAVAEFALSPAGAAISRYELDGALWRLVARSGADCRQQVEVWAIQGRETFLIETSAGNFTARSIINATGRWSNLRRRGLAEPKREKWVGWKAHFCEHEPAHSVDLYFFSGGYCGVQSLGEGRVNACAMVHADVARSLAEVLSLHPELEQRSRSWQPVSETVATSPLIFGAPEPEENGILFVGDAAGFIDPFVGDGISLALRSGIMAAGALADYWAGRSSLMEAAGVYRRCYDRELRLLFRNAEWLRRLTAIPKALHRPVMAILGSPMVMRFLVGKTRKIS